jgi:hypothetical protein
MVLPQKILFHLSSPPTLIQIVTILNLYRQITHSTGPQGSAQGHGDQGRTMNDYDPGPRARLD